MTQLQSRLSTIVAIVGLMFQGCSAGSGDLDAMGQSEHSVIHPTECRADASPAAVAVLSNAKWQASSGVTLDRVGALCSGTLIAPDVVLTAAHCIVSDQFFVSFSHDVETSLDARNPLPPDVVPVTQSFVHPDYGKGVYDHDLALLILSWPQDVPPELLLTGAEGAQVVSGMPIEFMGWGMGGDNGNSTGRRNCGYEKVATVTPGKVSIDSSSESHLCHGDSGGPNFIHIETPNPVKRRLAAVTSYGEGSCSATSWVIRVDVQEHQDWIDETLRSACEKGERTWCEIPGILPACYFDEKPCLPEKEGEGKKGCNVAGADSIAALLMVIVLRRAGRNSRGDRR